MPFELFLALRYLRARRGRRLARITALVAILGIATGVAALIVALALANGFRDEMREKILRGTAHLNVVRADGQPLRDHNTVASRIKQIPGVTNAFGTTYDGAVIIGPKGSGYAVLRGVDETNPAALSEIKSWLTAGSAEEIGKGAQDENYPPAVIVGSELANRIGSNVGDVVQIIPAANPTAATAVPGSGRRFVRVSGIFRSGLFEYDSTWIYISLKVAAQFAASDHAATVVSVQLSDIYAVKRVATEIQQTLGESYTTIDWQDANRPLFTALALERRMGLFIIALIILIAALNITTTLILVVVDRSREIGILGAMGASSKSIMGIFMMEGAIIGALGALLGVGLGTIACLIGNRYQLVSLPADVYSISNVPFHSQLRDVALAAAVAFLLSLIATIYPARAAARVRPVEMLRDTN
ncbi:MAG TPA: FtsX-like permease family protein [Pyrinomonadaceae bacterium]|nr:FtsX-like permease family protein [Pyrinomonadaceae bacterium]